jgi:hypothetical protein
MNLGQSERLETAALAHTFARFDIDRCGADIQGGTRPRESTTGLRPPEVTAFQTSRWLLWEKPGSTWAWLLKPLPEGRTRLVLRIRADYPDRASGKEV